MKKKILLTLLFVSFGLSAQMYPVIEAGDELLVTPTIEKKCVTVVISRKTSEFCYDKSLKHEDLVSALEALKFSIMPRDKHPEKIK